MVWQHCAHEACFYSARRHHVRLSAGRARNGNTVFEVLPARIFDPSLFELMADWLESWRCRGPGPRTSTC